jgi:hypothetical protein
MELSRIHSAHPKYHSSPKSTSLVENPGPSKIPAHMSGSETRLLAIPKILPNSKHEIRNSKQYQMTKIQMTQTLWLIFAAQKHHRGCLFLSLEHSGFGFVSDFYIRISDLTVLMIYTA